MRNLTHFILGSTALLCSTILFSLGFIIPNITNAQTGPMAPGYEILPKHLQADAETPLVLSSVASPKFCLAMPTEDIDSKTLIVWPCGTAWFQKIWFDKMTAIKAKAKDKVRLRVGTLGCLVSKQKIGASANFAICGDFPKDEVWSMSGGQLRDNSGLCLTLAEAKDGVPPLMQKCEASSDNQQWRLESMRAASKRHPPANKDSSGLGEYHYLGYLPEIVEEFRPRFTQRELTDEEKAELKKIVSTWSDYDPIEELAHKFSTPPFNIKWKTLLRLSELGESGDKKAMRAVMEAFALLRDTGGYNRTGDLYSTGWDSKDFANAQNGELAYRVAQSLANIWAAHYWQKHGEDRLAGDAFVRCYPNGFSCIGYKFNAAGSLFDWVLTGKGATPHSVSNITFVPVAGTPAEREERFLGYLDGSFKGRVNQNVYDQYFLASQAVYAEQTGRLALWDNVMLNRSVVYPVFTSKQELNMRETLKVRADVTQWKKKFDEFMAKKNTTPYEQGHMQAELLNRSDAELFRYAEKYDVWFQQLEPRLCSGKLETSKACVAIRTRIEKNRIQYAADIEKTRIEMANKLKIESAKKAERDEKYREELAKRAAERKPDFFEQLVDLAEGFAAAAAAGSEQVTVRKYDNAGNFLGTESMTRARAAGLGAQSK